MNNPVNILLIVEGKNTEPDFFTRLSNCYGLNFDFYRLYTNIYTLYKKLKEYEFNSDIKDVLAEIHPDQKPILSKKFAYTYLIFDCDAHHPKKNDVRPIDKIVSDNIKKLKEMVDFFTDETDPTIGKLYINYPMMESFKDADKFFDSNYEFTTVCIEDLHNYKNIVSKKALSKKRVDKLSAEDFSQLARMTAYKLNKVVNGTWSAPKYDEYRSLSNAKTVLLAEESFVATERKINVLNTSLFLIVDYFGNKNGFYDAIIN